MSTTRGWGTRRSITGGLVMLLLLGACTTTRTPEIATSPSGPDGANGSNEMGPAPSPPGTATDSTGGTRPSPVGDGGPGVLPPNSEAIAASARSAPEIGDPLAPPLPMIETDVASYLGGEGRLLLDFHRATEPLVLGTADCSAVAEQMDAQGLAPAELYMAASGIPDDIIASAFVNDIAEKLRHVVGCNLQPSISFTHTVVARIFATAGVS